ncbi:hypothetical protein H9P43_000566 [Blastocladiella emersonii ATCC 22665]|nr:hypothetical protein H9P43_000566 [Blastocladiella emersonii ATCC 22665]
MAPKEWERKLLNKYAEPQVMAVMIFNLILSTTLMLVAGRRLLLHRTRFHIGVAVCALGFFVNDIVFFGVLAADDSPNIWELTRVFSPIVCGAQVAALGFERFRIFGATSHAPYYTNRLRKRLLALVYTFMVVAIVLLISTYWSTDLGKKVDLNPLRKITILGASALFVLSDLVITTTIFRIVLNIRMSLDYARNRGGDWTTAGGTQGGGITIPSFITLSEAGRQQQRARAIDRAYRTVVYRILAALIAMLASCTTGVVAYAFADSVFSHQFAGIFGRLYVLAAMVEWYLVVDLVRDRRRDNGRPSGGSTSVQYGVPSMSEQISCVASVHVKPESGGGSSAPTPAVTRGALRNGNLSGRGYGTASIVTAADSSPTMDSRSLHYV